VAYTLPELPYAYDALEPHIDARTMEIHHSKHHNAYIQKVNAALEGTDFENTSIEKRHGAFLRGKMMSSLTPIGYRIGEEKDNNPRNKNHCLFGKISNHSHSGYSARQTGWLVVFRPLSNGFFSVASHTSGRLLCDRVVH